MNFSQSSVLLITELADVLARPRLTRRFGFSHQEVSQYIALIRTLALHVPVTGSVQVCRDPDDDLVIETAIVGRASFLVTRDDDLKDALEVTRALNSTGLGILSVQHFLEHLQTMAASRAQD